MRRISFALTIDASHLCSPQDAPHSCIAFEHRVFVTLAIPTLVAAAAEQTLAYMPAAFAAANFPSHSDTRPEPRPKVPAHTFRKGRTCYASRLLLFARRALVRLPRSRKLVKTQLQLISALTTLQDKNENRFPQLEHGSQHQHHPNSNRHFQSPYRDQHHL